MALSYPLIKLSLDNWRRLEDWKMENIPNRAQGNLLVPNGAWDRIRHDCVTQSGSLGSFGH